MKVNITGFDPSLNNWGISHAKYNTETNELKILDGDVLRLKSKDKNLKQNQKDLIHAKSLYSKLQTHLTNTHICCIELPIGSQSSRAMVSYAMCIGLIGSLMNQFPNVYFIFVSPYKVKQVVGTNTTTKEEIIQWVTTKHPEYDLPKAKNQAEHIADSICTIYAGLINQPNLKEIINEINLNSN